jgi:superfamily II DNA or RNA helicase
MNNFLKNFETYSENEKQVILAIALKTSFRNTNSISALLNNKYRLSSINTMMKELVEQGVLKQDYQSGELVFNQNLLVHLVPKMTQLSYAINQTLEYSYNFYHRQVFELRDFLLRLVYNQKMFKQLQESIDINSNHIIFKNIIELFEIEEYFPYLEYLNEDVVKRALHDFIKDAVKHLLSLHYIEERCNRITAIYPKATTLKPFVKHFIEEHFINLSTVKLVDTKQFPKHYYFYQNAAIHLLNHQAEIALKAFIQGIKMQSKLIKGLKIPFNNFYVTLYFANLIMINDENTTNLLTNIQKSKVIEEYNYEIYMVTTLLLKIELDKNNYFDKNILENYTSEMRQNILQLICLSYLLDYKPAERVEEKLHTVVREAYNSGYISYAYEGAFALKSMTNRSKDITLYNQIHAGMPYEPILSQVVKVEEWEKKLSKLINMLPAESETNNTSLPESSTRIMYELNLEILDVQPILQTMNKNGKWSTGRNISLKKFYAGEVEGMTEQDYKIAKCLRNESNYYPSTYIFMNKVYSYMVGHPNLYLRNSGIPIELVAAEPIFNIKKVKNSYQIQVDLNLVEHSTFVIKETNTRYKVYDLDPKTIEFVNFVISQRIEVPEKNVEKLEILVKKLSKKTIINSDLIASNQHSNVKQVKADPKLRVQLLPYGNGLKAEIFAKPFGTIPPYFKPGMGGQTLITSHKNEQLQVIRNLELEKKQAKILIESISKIESVDLSNDLITFDLAIDSLNLLEILSKHADLCIVEWPEGEKFKIKGSADFKNLKLRIKSQTNWFDIAGEIQIDEQTVLSLKELMNLMENKQSRFVELSNGEFLALSDELKKKIMELMSFTTSTKDTLTLNKFASATMGNFFDEIEDLKVDKAWKDFQKRIEITNQESIEIPKSLEAELRPYQEEGFRWLSRLASWEAGACLADDMGLGKTIQTLAILIQRSKNGAALVVCPVSVVNNWISEATKFAPTLKIKTLGLSTRQQIINQLEAGDVLITSYGILQSEEKMFAEVSWDTVVLDEAHVIKNFATKTSKAAMGLKTKFKLALTGTPIQNHLGEIWNIFNFINPGLLGNLQHFNDVFVKPEGNQAKKHLKKLISPFILRRTKTSVLDELPPKTEIIRKIELSKEEAAFYEALRRQAIENMESGEGNSGAKHLQALAEITKLRQASCNPALVNPTLKIESSKLNTFLQIADELIENKHRALVFSQFVTHLSLVRKALDQKGIKYSYLDGSTSANEREKLVRHFQAGTNDLFLISLKAGGLGLNLTAADFVIHLDPWWNPAIEDQASDRAHRIGQSRPVTVYRLVAENTIEEKIIQLHNSKRNMAELLLEGSDQAGKLSLHELVDLIKGE